MIYTSYFAQLKNLPKDVIPIAICGKPPKWNKGLLYKKLAPKYKFFAEWKKNQDNEFYKRHFYSEVLGVLQADNVVKELFAMAKSEKIALICYEKPSDFCHRHLVSEWLNEHGIQCQEYKR